MIRRGFWVLVAVGLLAGAPPANAVGNVRREKPARRPYIVEVGEPYEISMESLQVEAEDLSELKEYLRNYGYPNYAEVQEIQPQWPWDSREVRVYYLRNNQELDFGHVILSGAAPDLGVTVFEGQIPPDKAHQIEVILQARQTPPPPAPVAVTAAPQMVPAAAPSTGGLSEALVARIEAAAERAAQAADRAVSESEAAVSAADRTESIVAKFEEGTPRKSRPRY
jgi:hypothetical protein